MIPHRIVVLGGSTVYGQGDPEGGGFVSRFRAWHEPRHHANRVFNLGVGGDTVRAMLTRGAAECAARRPELILLYPGLNDSRRLGSPDAPCTPIAEFSSTLHLLIGELKALAPLVIMTSVPLDGTRTAPYFETMYFSEPDGAALNRAVRETAEELHLPYLDTYARWCASPHWRALLCDGIHCSPEGHAILAAEVREFLCSLFGDREKESAR